MPCLWPAIWGVAATIFGMTWARAAIFYCSDSGKMLLEQVFYACRVDRPTHRHRGLCQSPTSHRACDHPAAGSGSNQPNVMKQLFHLARTRGSD